MRLQTSLVPTYDYAACLKRYFLALTLAALILMALPPASVYAVNQICYVKADAAGANDGSSWTNAFTDLQSTLGTSTCTEVWVAAGTYYPGASGARTASFNLKNGVAIYGGFAGTESSRSERNWTAHETILSGDQDSSASFTPNDAYNIVKSSNLNSTAVLDGFIIRDGYSPFNGAGGYGAGIYNNNSSPTLENLVLIHNLAWMGGGLFNTGAAPLKLKNVTLRGNLGQTDIVANTGYGGGLMNNSNSTLILVNVSFMGNSSLGGGGGLYNTGTATLANVIFSGNTTITRGGGMYSTGSATLTNVTFAGNVANTLNAGIGYGGGLFTSNTTAAELNNVIMWGNTSPNNPQVGYNPGTPAPVIAYSLIQDAYDVSNVWDATLGTDGGGNLDADPLFTDADGTDNIMGTSDDNLRLQEASPAIDAGSSAALPTDVLDLDNDSNVAETLPLDMDLHARRFTHHPALPADQVDLGPYEYPNTAPVISSSANQFTLPSTPTGALAFTVSDAETYAANLTLSGASSNLSLLPVSGISFGGSGGSRTATLSPAAGQTGTTTVTLTVSDGLMTASTAFTLTVSQHIRISTPLGAASNAAAGASGQVLYRLDIASDFDATFTGITLTPSGNYQLSDLATTAFRLRFSTDSTLDAGDLLLAALPAAAPGAPLVFNGFSQAVPSGSLRYVFLTVDLSIQAAAGRFIYVDTPATEEITFALGTHTGSLSAGGARLFTAVSAAYADHLGGCGGSSPCFTSLQAAIEAVQPGGTVAVTGSLFNESVTLNKNVSVTLLGDVTLDLGSLTVAAGSFHLGSHTLTVQGDFTNLGGFDAGTGTLLLNGSSLQTLSGVTTTFHHLTLDNPGGAEVYLNGVVDGTLTLQRGALSIYAKTFTLNQPVVTGSGSMASLLSTTKYAQSTPGQTVAPGQYGHLVFNDQAKTLPSDGTVSIRGNFDPGVAASHTVSGSTLAFNGSGVQTIARDVNLNNLRVEADSILTTAARVSLAGILTNLGWIKETRLVSGPAAFTFNLTGTGITLTEAGTTASLEVARRDQDHPNRTAEIESGRYWTIQALDASSHEAMGFLASLTLPKLSAVVANDALCRWAATTWNCAGSSINTNLNTITRAGIDHFSDWALGKTSTVTTNAATAITPSAATLNGTVNANNLDTTVTFEYGLDVSYGNTITAQESPISGSGDTPVTALLTGLKPNTSYHFRVVVINSSGTTYGADQVFTTAQYSTSIPLIKR